MPKKLIDPRSSITEETSRRIANALEYIAIADAKDIDITDYQQIANIVKAGRAKDFFEIGDQIHTTWKPDDEHEYDMPWDVVDFGPCEDPDGNIHENAMWLESHYALPAIMPYKAAPANYVADHDLPEGIYHFVVDIDFLTYKAGTPFQFNTDKTISSGSCFLLYGVASNLSVQVYSGPSFELYAGYNLTPNSNEGEDLGEFSFNNSMDYNHWNDSDMRQWLNSDKPVGEWWKQLDTHYIPPTIAKRAGGFKTQITSDFLKIIRPIVVGTQYTLEDNKYVEGTIDYFFCPSLTQIFCYSTAKGEGKAFQYWVNLLGQETARGSKNYNDKRITYYVDNKTTASAFSLRTKSMNDAHYIVHPRGSVYAINVSGTTGIVPCCVIY